MRVVTRTLNGISDNVAYEVVLVGSGGAGLSAALCAALLCR
jgi:ribulose 1,5-bisphosphate synthetase/thiazole synthase